MKNITRVVCTAAALLVTGAAAQDGGKAISKTTISLGTATPGGGFPVYGDAFAEADERGRSDALDRAAQYQGQHREHSAAGGRQARSRAGAGEPPMRPLWASAGRRPAEILTAMYSTPGMFVVRADSPYRTIGDLKGKPVAFGAKGSGLPILSRYMLDGLGMKRRGLQVDLPRPRRRRPGDGAGRPRRGVVGRRHRLARVQSWRKPRRRALHRARCERDRAASGPSTPS